jgi:spermidine synthase
VGEGVFVKASSINGTLVVSAVLFFLSGFSALIYQVAWQRILSLQSGVGVYSITVIVAAFMTGLGLGNYLGGVGSQHISTQRRSLVAFAVIELLIAAFAAASVALYYHVLYVKFGSLYRSEMITAVLHFSSLIVPTALMGMSLPFLVRATVTSVSAASTQIGLLYGVNILGAAAGAGCTPWVLIRYLGIDGAVYVGSLSNLVAAVGIFAISVSKANESGETPPSSDVSFAKSDSQQVEQSVRWPFGVWLGLYAVSGFIALALEILWFRVIDVTVKSTAYTFGTVLAVYLIGLGIGTFAGIALVRRVLAPHRAFLLCQVAVVVSGALGILIATSLPVDFPVYRDFFGYWNDYEPMNPLKPQSIMMLLGLYVVQPAALFLVPTLLMGMGFVFLQQAVQTDVRAVGRKLGFLQTVNICGNVLGSVTIGFIALDYLGTADCFRLCFYLGAVFPVVGLMSFRQTPLFGACLLLILAAASAVPESTVFWQRLHGIASDDAAAVGFFAEDTTSVVAITPVTDKAEFESGVYRVSVNGKGHSWLPFGGVHSNLGALGAILHPAPEEICMIGLGSGDTAWAAGFRPETRRITIYEIAAPQWSLLKRIEPVGHFGELTRLVNDARIDVIVEDGRTALAMNTRDYDLIEADAIRPTSGYAGNLYSKEFFLQCADRLKSRGLMVQWGATPRVVETFRSVFPHVVRLDPGPIMIGSNEPIGVDPSEWKSRLEQAHEYLGDKVAKTVNSSLSSLKVLNDGKPTNGERLNRDLFPRDEFGTP